MHDESGAPLERARRLAFLFPIILAALVVWSGYRVPGLTADGVTYLQIARNILMGKGLGWQALWASPFHSILVAGVSALAGIPDLLTASGIVSAGMFFCLVVAVYYLALELFDLRTALVAALLTALSPHLDFIAFSPEAEITFTFLLVLALLFVARAVARGSKLYAGAAGVAFALAWMTRSEGLLAMVFVFAAVTALQGRAFHRSQLFRYSLLGALFFMLTAAPYLLFLHKHYGSFVMSPKASYVMIWMKGKVYHDNDKDETGNDELWGLTADGSRLRWQEPKGIGDLVGYLMSHPRRSASVYLHNLGMELPGRIPNNSGMERYPQLYPLYLALPALLALFLPWGSAAREKKAILAAPLLILLVLPVFTEGWWKYLVPYLPVLVLLAARGLSGGSALLAERVVPGRAATVAGVLLCGIAVAIGARFVHARHPFALETHEAAAGPSSDVSGRALANEEARKAGLYAVTRFGAGKNYMATWGKIVYHLEGEWTALPVAADTDVLNYARRNGVDYVVVELLGPSAAGEVPVPRGFELAGVYRSLLVKYTAAFYRVPR